MKKVLIILAIISLVFFIFALKTHNDFYTARGPNSKETVKFSVAKGEGASAIAQNLKKTGINKKRFVF